MAVVPGARRPVVYDDYGGVLVARRAPTDAATRYLRREVARRLPPAWVGRIGEIARAARQGLPPWQAWGAEFDVLAHYLSEYAGARAADWDEAAIRARAEECAAAARDLLATLGAVGERERGRFVQEFAKRRGAPITFSKLRGISYYVARVCCYRWWRRQLRKHVAQNYERGAVALGLVGASARAWYASDRAVIRRRQQKEASAAALAATRIESADGQSMTLAQAAALSVSNPAIRRGELMTRIAGCERWADAAGWSGLFVTLTCPSRFHAARAAGGANPRFDGSTPRAAQEWLCAQWARVRARWSRQKIEVAGFRVAEPHHDGCPHWHALLWCPPEHVEAVRESLRAQWLKDAGDEPGAQRFRVKAVAMLPGQAAGYVAKYVAKNIDDAGAVGVEGHHDHDYLDADTPQQTQGRDLLGHAEILPSQRVEAWAALWRIRQFQAFGQPPVGVWRELRRTTRAAVAPGSHALIAAWSAAHREGERRADWCAYMHAQGGAAVRGGYRLCVHAVERERRGRYGDTRERWACGVRDTAGGALPVTPTRRVEWGAEGFAARQRRAPWTRFYNCSQWASGRTPTLDDLPKIRRGLGLANDLSEAGPAARQEKKAEKALQ